jgi:hypothetical protein
MFMTFFEILLTTGGFVVWLISTPPPLRSSWPAPLGSYFASEYADGFIRKDTAQASRRRMKR